MWLSKFLFLMLLPFCAWASPSAPKAEVEVRIEARVRVSSTNVVLGDVATIYAKRGADFQALSGLVISRFPDDQKEFKLPQMYLEARIREALPPQTQLTLHGPQEIAFELHKMGVEPKDLALEIERLARAEKKIPESVELEVLPLTNPDQLKLLQPGSFHLESASQQAEWRGEMPFKLIQADGTLIWVKAKLRWFAQAWVAQKNYRLGQALTSSDFSQQRVEVTHLRGENLIIAPSSEDFANRLQSATAKRSIMANAPLTSSMVAKIPDGRLGQLLKVVFVSDSGIRVTTDGALLSNGIVGDELKARLRSSKRIVTGRLMEGGTLEVNL